MSRCHPTLTPTMLAGLGPRECDVLWRLINGASEKQIAATLGLSAHTVHAYVKSIYQKLNVRSRGELLALVFRYLLGRLDAPAPMPEMPDLSDPVLAFLRTHENLDE